MVPGLVPQSVVENEPIRCFYAATRHSETKAGTVADELLFKIY